MTRERVAVALLCALVFAALGTAQAAVVKIYPGTRLTGPGVEPAEWQLANGWSIVTNKMGVGKMMASGPSVCETPYEPFKAYNLTNVGGSLFPRWTITQPPTVKQDMGRGAFYASCDHYYGQNGNAGVTPSSVWIGTDQHGGRSLVGVKLSQITKMKYYGLVSGIPTWLAPGASDASWDSWKQAWYNPRFPIMLTLTVEGPLGRRQLWYRPWGDHSTIGDQASDGRLSIWEQYDCLTYGKWYCPGDHEYDAPTQYNTWSEVIAAYGEYTLVPTSTSHDPASGQWKSPGYTDYPEAEVTDPPGLPACTATGKCLNFWVGGRFYHLLRPDEYSYKTWYPESRGFRGQMDYFEFRVNYGTPTSPDYVDVTYDFEPAVNDPGPRKVYLNMACLRSASDLDRLVDKRGEPESKYDPIANPLKDTKEERLYDVLYKVSGTVMNRLNPYFEIDDGANLTPWTRVYVVFQDRWNTPSHSALWEQHWSSWGLIERFRASGSAPYVDKPFIVWTAKTHDLRLQ